MSTAYLGVSLEWVWAGQRYVLGIWSGSGPAGWAPISMAAVALAACLGLVLRVAWPAWRSVRRASPIEPVRVAPGRGASERTQQVLALEVALDERTRFPCIRLPRGFWMQLLPVTKLQVEQWISEGGRRAGDGRQVTHMVRRMEDPAAGGHYPPTVIAAKRRSIRDLGSQDVLSVIATNLSLWSDPRELEGPECPSFPTPTSDWGEFLTWLDAEMPSYEQAAAVRRDLAALPTAELLRAVVKRLPPSCPLAVQQLLKSLAEGIDPERRGLPFADSGVWEVVNKPVAHGRLIQGGRPVEVYHPEAVGRTPLWPYLELSDRHVLLHHALPMVGIRGIPRRVTECFPIEVPFRVGPDAGSIAVEPPPIRRRFVAKKGETTMAERCPLCYQPIESAVWRSAGNIWCAEVRVEEGDDIRTKSVHETKKPSGMRPRRWRVASEEMISNDYREIARDFPDMVRPVCVSGYSQEGKTCFLLSLMGSLFYPDRDPLFSRIFPERLGVRRTLAALAVLNEAGQRNLFRSLEEMWIDGFLPLPNPIERALSSSIIFSSSVSRFGRRRNRRLALIINDIAGEATGPELAHLPAFPHVPYCRDVIYILRASELNTSALRFDRFAAYLNQGIVDGRRIDRKRLNLILCISQLDRTDADPDVRKICTQTPCVLPERRDETEFHHYRNGMVRVHEGIRSSLLRRFRSLVTDAEAIFGSVRYCGFSSFGHHPLPGALAPRPDCNGCLVAAPRPVRVMDPLLWILWDQGLLDD